MKNDLPGNSSIAKRTALVEFERQVERGNLFTHTALSENAQRISEIKSFLYGLINILINHSIVTQDEIGEAAVSIMKIKREAAEYMQTDQPYAADISVQTISAYGMITRRWSLIWSGYRRTFLETSIRNYYIL